MSSSTQALTTSPTPKHDSKMPTITQPPLLLSESAMERTYQKLADRLRDKAIPGQQYWVALAGGPGSGKTTTAEAVRDILNTCDKNDNDNNNDQNKEICVVLPMDGFHLSKAVLAERDPPDGANLLKRRGAPWTMDHELCFQLLQQAKQNHQGELPTYCRKISDPVPGGVRLEQHHQIVIVEGLYLLLANDPDWQPLQDLWEERWFIRCPSREQQRQRLIDRHMKNWSDLKIKTWGPGREGAIAKTDATDVKNMDIVAASEAFCDVVIESR